MTIECIVCKEKWVERDVVNYVCVECREAGYAAEPIRLTTPWDIQEYEEGLDRERGL